MIKWNLRFYIIISILYFKFANINCEIEDQGDYNKSISEYYNYQLEQETVLIKYIYYTKKNIFTFKNTSQLTANNTNITEIKKDITSIIIKNRRISTIKFLVEPKINSGNNDKNIDFKTCPVIINSLYIDKFEITIKEKESMALSFTEFIPYIILQYKIQNLNEDSFIILSFIVDENNIFNIDINNELNRNISSNTNIFLDYSKLSNIENDTLTIKIIFNKENISEKKYNVALIFKLIESNSISILRKNILNQGFTI